MINTNCWRQPIPVSVFELPTTARLIYQELLMSAARNDNGGSFTTKNKHHYKLERGQCFFSDLTLASTLNIDPKTVEKWRNYLEKRGNRVGNRVGSDMEPIIRSRPTQDGRIYTLLDYDKVTGMGNSLETSMGNTVGSRVGTDIRLQNTDTLTYAPAREPDKVIETKNVIIQTNGEKEMQPLILAQEPFLPKVPPKGISPLVRSDALVALVQIAKEYGCSIRWENNEDEIKEAVDLLGLDQVLQSMRDYSDYCAKKGFTQVYWPKFKEHRLNATSPKAQVERVKKSPEYLDDRKNQLAKRTTVSYTSMPNMSKLSDSYSDTLQQPKDPVKDAFIERSKLILDKLQRPGLEVRLGMGYIDHVFFDSISDKQIIAAANKILDTRLADAKLSNKITTTETIGRSDLISYLKQGKDPATFASAN